ncbi:MAG: hypothetical protein U1E99_08000 [Agitococcus sp.]
MKMLKKLALVSAISAISVSAFAMEAMDDEAMATTTGQDGITINIVPDAISRTTAQAMGVTAPTMDAISPSAPLYKGLSIGEIRVHDDDGLGTLGSSATANSGALVIGGGADGADAAAVKADRTVILAKGDKPIQINVDMVGDSNGSATGGGAMLNVEIKQPDLAIKLGNIYVANSNAAPDDYNADGGADNDADSLDNQDGTGLVANSKVKIMDGLEIVMASSTMKIQLGNESQGSMIVADATLTNGLTINNFALYDQQGAAALTADNLLTGTVGSGGSFRASSIKITDNGGNDLTTKTSIDFGSRIAVASDGPPVVYSTVTTAGKDAFIKEKSGGGFASVAAANAAITNVTTLRDAEAVSQFGAGSTYAALSDGDKNSVNTAVSTANAAAYIAGTVTAPGLIAAADYAGSIADTVASTGGTWGGRDTYNGLVITSQLGDAATGANIAINNAAVGDMNAAVIGDVQIIGLMLGKSKIVIMGH